MTAPAISEFDRLVAQLMAAAPGISLEKARATIGSNRPDLVEQLGAALGYNTTQLRLERDNVLEKDEQAYIAKLFKGFGCKVYNLSQARATKQTKGLPDLWVVCTLERVAFWFETKRSIVGRTSPEQKDFAAECAIAGVRHYIGDRRAAAKLLVDLGLARVGEGPCGIVPFHDLKR